jgi:hypothetical protein
MHPVPANTNRKNDTIATGLDNMTPPEDQFLDYLFFVLCAIDFAGTIARFQGLCYHPSDFKVHKGWCMKKYQKKERMKRVRKKEQRKREKRKKRTL